MRGWILKNDSVLTRLSQSKELPAWSLPVSFLDGSDNRLVCCQFFQVCHFVWVLRELSILLLFDLLIDLLFNLFNQFDFLILDLELNNLIDFVILLFFFFFFDCNRNLKVEGLLLQLASDSLSLFLSFLIRREFYSGRWHNNLKVACDSPFSFRTYIFLHLLCFFDQLEFILNILR